MRASIIELLTPNGGEEEEILDFERGVSGSELGKTGAALTGIAEGNFGLAESLARCRGGLFCLSFKIHNPKFNIARRAGRRRRFWILDF